MCTQYLFQNLVFEPLHSLDTGQGVLESNCGESWNDPIQVSDFKALVSLIPFRIWCHHHRLKNKKNCYVCTFCMGVYVCVCAHGKVLRWILNQYMTVLVYTLGLTEALVTFSSLGTSQTNWLAGKLTLLTQQQVERMNGLNINFEQIVPSGLAVKIPIKPNYGSPENWMLHWI